MSNNRIFAVGQRWLSDTEPDLGLGTVSEIQGRTVTLQFNASEEQRQYAQASAPLTRLILKPGHHIDLAEMLEREDAKQAEIVDVNLTPQHTLVYQVRVGDETHPLPEVLLPDDVSMNRPLDRLFAGQFESHYWFNLKRDALRVQGQAERSGLMGLSSVRAELIPHQVYIANEVASRYAPRVMLADEVGLGKTIEAGMILQQQLVSGLAKRALIVVPDALTHQWLVEMLRRFNLRFTILDKARIKALRDSDGDNPFQSAQLVLCPLSLFAENSSDTADACQAGWDLCIIDEAHHIEAAHIEADYFETDHVLNGADPADAQTELTKQTAQPASRDNASTGDQTLLTLQHLAAACKGLLLLSATPEQMGNANFFALLQLLDPARFNDYPSFLKEQQAYQKVAADIDKLQDKFADKPEQLADLLDQHGTGRVLFRNTRQNLQGFPKRVLHPHPLSPDAAAAKLPSTSDEDNASAARLAPHSQKLAWLADWLPTVDGKALLICASDDLAIAIDYYLRRHAGIRSTVFNRKMSLLERDRAAAYFAGDESDEAARILVCSEIGSEGRNFQFCQHLVLFDLPDNPDLLEQRIGRLDRIGQQGNVNLHVPYRRENADGNASPEAILFHWYDQGLNAFTQIASTGWRLWQEFREPLQAQLQGAGPAVEPASADESADESANESAEKNPNKGPDQSLSAFLKAVATRREALQQDMEQGRDRLLELNSFNADTAAKVIEKIRKTEQDSSLKDWMIQVLDRYNVHNEENLDGSYTVIPSDDMLLPVFPGLPEDGIDACFERDLAVRREDRAFLSWQHPMINGALDLVMSSHQGKASVSLLEWQPSIPARTDLIMTCLFRIKVSAPSHLQLAKYLPETAFILHAVMDEDGKFSVLPGNEKLYTDSGLRPVDDARPAITKVLAEYQRKLNSLAKKTRKLAQVQTEKLAALASKHMLERQTAEIKRLLALQQRNPNIREEEIDYLKDQTRALHECLSQAKAQLVAVHTIFPDPAPPSANHEQESL